MVHVQNLNVVQLLYTSWKKKTKAIQKHLIRTAHNLDSVHVFVHLHALIPMVVWIVYVIPVLFRMTRFLFLLFVKE